MLSIAQNIAELDRLAHARNDVLASYAQTVRDTATHLPEIRRELLAPCQEALLAAAAMIEAAQVPEQWREASLAVRHSLARFQEEATRFVQSLQSNLASTSAMLQRLMGQLGAMGGDHHQGLQADITQLREVIAVEDLTFIRRAVEETTGRMAARIEQLKREQSLVVAQLQEEIQILHRQLEERAAAARPAPPPATANATSQADEPPAKASPESVAEPAVTSPMPNGMRREEFVAALQLKSDHGETYSVAICWLSNLAQLFTRYDPEVVIEVMQMASNRMRELVLDNPLWTRWEDDCFAVCTPEPKAPAARASHALAAKISGDYTVKRDGQRLVLPLRVVAGVVERIKDEPLQKTLERLNQMAKSLRTLA